MAMRTEVYYVAAKNKSVVDSQNHQQQHDLDGAMIIRELIAVQWNSGGWASDAAVIRAFYTGAEALTSAFFKYRLT